MENKVKSHRATIAKFLKFCEDTIASPEFKTSKGFLEGKESRINDLWTKIDATNDKIAESDITEYEVTTGPEFKKMVDSMEQEYNQAFNMVDNITVLIYKELEKLTVETKPQIQPLQLPENLVLNTNSTSNIKLKPIDIPKFSGDYKKWISFRNMFESLVHKYKNITNLQKIHYLRSCLSDEAERLISQFDISEESYVPAYTALTDRFHNEVILVDTHIISLLSQPNLTSETSNGLKELMDVTTENLRALTSLGIDTSSWDPILLLLLVQKLDHSTRRLWEQTLKPKIRPTLNQFLDFLATRFHALGCRQKFSFSIDSLSMNSQGEIETYEMESELHHQQNESTVFPPRIHQSFYNSSQPACPVCSGTDHSIFACRKFSEAKVRARLEMAAGARLCNRCLKNHRSDCNQREGCRVCGENHHTFLHLDKQESRESQPMVTQNQRKHQSRDQTVENQPSTIVNSHHIRLNRSLKTPIMKSHHVSTMVNNQIDRQSILWDVPVLLATAIILVRSLKDNILYPFRCLLDQGGETSHITEAAAQKLGINKIPISVSMSGLGGTTVVSSNSAVEFEIGSKVNQSFAMNIQAVVVPKVTNSIPSSRISKTDWSHIEGIRLTDPEYYKPGDIDIALGASIYGCLLLPGLRKGLIILPWFRLHK